MKTLILNGNPKKTEFDNYLSELAESIKGDLVILRNLNIKYYTGC